MTTPTKVHCFFEQSGTFKNEFRKLGIPAEDYDIQNNFGETDHVIDIFAEIERGYDGKPSVFDEIGVGGDLIMAFFPCIMFCGISQMNMTLECYKKNHGTVVGAGDYILRRSRERQRFLELLMKFCFVCIDRGLRMVFENPYSMNTYLKNGFIKPPDVVDTDRTMRGDFFQKATGYWFFNCEPERGVSVEKTPKEKVRHILMHTYQYKRTGRDKAVVRRAKTGICDEERSMISSDYARNFIADFILGRPLGGRPQQQDLFAEVQA